ncbi:hypothetical protein J2T60_001568 [Natronospira proteinivora]|uniref:Uncharacterized protein n=1 Tax=Natronospira proteinivora TaxID=1807133 RepID=A0ABT1GBB7_9GAMM|nr:hypothetical protein [Natronospira proteinivora]MCP1727568.1 hypothetical protein [Natronospira proteinivora]
MSMFGERLQSLVDKATAANEAFNAKHSDAFTVVGASNESLRRLGDDVDAVSIDDRRSNQRLMFILKDSMPDSVGIGIGTPGGEDLEFIGEARLDSLDEMGIISLMERHFDKSKSH